MVVLKLGYIVIVNVKVASTADISKNSTVLVEGLPIPNVPVALSIRHAVGNNNLGVLHVNASGILCDLNEPYITGRYIFIAGIYLINT